MVEVNFLLIAHNIINNINHLFLVKKIKIINATTPFTYNKCSRTKTILLKEWTNKCYSRTTVDASTY